VPKLLKGKTGVKKEGRCRTDEDHDPARRKRGCESDNGVYFSDQEV
jgi:hypothetical protein